ncbi:MAG: L-serine ammonia-lyase, iron-sulfur-dependent, subunit alpha [Bacillota bacterium]|nr:L-serine ammonia-lyase, iron-sulfur-dependent, subunit alpha [Bacillota bacterium]
MLDAKKIDAYIAFLEQELVPATGCTEPIALAYAAAKLREMLGGPPQKIIAEVSGNIIKNVKSVVVPNTGGLKGISPAIAAGIIAGNTARLMRVIEDVSDAQQKEIAAYLENLDIEIKCSNAPRMLDIHLTGILDARRAVVHIANSHCNVIYLEENGKILLNEPADDSNQSQKERPDLTVQEIVKFADQVDLERIRPLLKRQIEYNSAIAEEGIRGDWGANLGKVILSDFGDDIKTEAQAYAAAGSDARMSGCELPVVILSGSGNQGMTASLPVIRYAKRYNIPEERLYRALLVSDLCTLHQKSGIGKLSAYCGAVSAGCGAGAGIAYLLGGDYRAISHTLVNAVAILSGMICDGAKPSCAAKIAAAVEAGILGYHMFLHDQEFMCGEGIVTKGVDDTIANVGILAQEGMRQTDTTILKIMTKD